MHDDDSQLDALQQYIDRTSIASLDTPEAIDALGRLVDLAADLGSAKGLDIALNWASRIEERALTPNEQMTLDLFRGNIWLDRDAQVSRTGDKDKHEWSQPDLEQAVLSLRRVVANPAFESWPRVRRAQLYTNLGNSFSTLGRALDAIAYRDRAIELIPRFGMALGTRAESIDAFRGYLYDREDVLHYISAAAQGFAAANAPDAVYENPGYGAVMEKWAKRRDELFAALSSHEPVDSSTFSWPSTSVNVAYRKWCLDRRLVLNPLNDLGPLAAACRDSLHLPPIAPHDSRAEMLFGYLDAMKQEYASARWSLYEAVSEQGQHFSDLALDHHDTGDEPLYGLQIERLKGVYRTVYALFDKVALFINVYFAVGLTPRSVTFSQIWREKDRTLRPVFASSRNWPLRGLYWIARDLAESDFKDVIEPDAQAIAELRNYVEHRFVRIVARYGQSRGAQGLFYVVSLEDFIRRTFALMTRARASLIMLVSAVYEEERKKGPNRGPWTKLPRL